MLRVRMGGLHFLQRCHIHNHIDPTLFHHGRPVASMWLTTAQEPSLGRSIITIASASSPFKERMIVNKTPSPAYHFSTLGVSGILPLRCTPARHPLARQGAQCIAGPSQWSSLCCIATDYSRDTATDLMPHGGSLRNFKSASR